MDKKEESFQNPLNSKISSCVFVGMGENGKSKGKDISKFLN